MFGLYESNVSMQNWKNSKTKIINVFEHLKKINNKTLNVTRCCWKQILSTKHTECENKTKMKEKIMFFI